MDVKLIDMVIHEHIRANFQNLRTPVSVFIAFESEEGYNRALAIKENGMQVLWMGEKLSFEAAPEPNDIIWENRQITRRQRLWNTVITVVNTLLLLAFSFWFIFFLKQKEHEAHVKYEEMDC
jgi:hypothetical protein